MAKSRSPQFIIYESKHISTSVGRYVRSDQIMDKLINGDQKRKGPWQIFLFFHALQAQPLK